MKIKNLIVATATMLCALTANAQDRADQQHLTDPNSFSMILLGDPQGYVNMTSTNQFSNSPRHGVPTT